MLAAVVLLGSGAPANAAKQLSFAERMKLAESMYFNGNLDGAIRSFQAACKQKLDAFEPHLGLVNLHVNNTERSCT